LGSRPPRWANGAAALTALERQSCDAVLMDCQMPGLDGYETTRRLRQRELGTGRRTVVIGFTASSGPEVEAHCREAGMDGLLTKPLNPQALTACWRAPAPRPPGRPGLWTGADLAGQVMESFLARGRRWLADLPR